MDELDHWKRSIDLPTFAASRGYAIVKAKSSRASIVMAHPSGDRIVIARGLDEHWTYFSVGNPTDSGSIIDFVQQRDHLSLGEIRKLLRQWSDPRPEQPGRPTPAGAPSPPSSLSQSSPPPSASSPLLLPPPNEPDLHPPRFVTEWDLASPTSDFLYLQSRGLRPETLTSRQFAGTFRIEPHRGNILFAHRRDGELTGFEVKNHGWKGFSSGGTRSLWRSNPGAHTDRFVICESAIDGMSYHQMHPSSTALYASTAGAIGTRQAQYLTEVIESLPGASVIILALDNDEAGEDLSRQIEALARPRQLLRHGPPFEVGIKDWNDVLKRQERAFIEQVMSRAGLEQEAPQALLR